MPDPDSLAETIRALMSEALRIGLDAKDDFFAAGADSLAVQHVLTGLAELLGQEIPGWLLLDYPTADSLARAVVQEAIGT